MERWEAETGECPEAHGTASLACAALSQTRWKMRAHNWGSSLTFTCAPRRHVHICIYTRTHTYHRHNCTHVHTHTHTGINSNKRSCPWLQGRIPLADKPGMFILPGLLAPREMNAWLLELWEPGVMILANEVLMQVAVWVFYESLLHRDIWKCLISYA